ncbi:MAG TPA: SIMPL domain-containing protein [Candidatus Paceibacterota bacterium]|nr:SIMPL domain-containing protein [Candidatus Paceibacterota bacterium]
MDQKKQKQLVVTAIAFLIVLSISILSWGYHNYRQAQSIVNSDRIISFSAEGKVLAKPDVAKIVFDVINQGEKADIVQKENNEKMQAVIAFVKEQKVSEDDIKTIRYSLSPQYDYDWCREDQMDIYSRSCSPKIVGYQLDQAVEVKIRDFDKINSIVGGLSEKGANKISNVNFEIDDPEAYRNEARIQALNKIEERAQLLSRKTSISLGKIINISEGSSIYPIYRDVKMEAMSADSSGEMPSPIAPIESGTEEISITLNVTYELR